ncbi:MAG: TonB-dependent receptor [Opitutales bacterium]|nr:TonB-dependent receptor [Opitutales bacterium]
MPLQIQAVQLESFAVKLKPTLTLFLLPLLSSLADEPVFDLEPLVVRGDPRAQVVGISGERPGDASWTTVELDQTAFASWEALWRQQASFDTFRRSDSRSAHPTTQGMRLRPVGTNAASRSLVLMDGLPLNDPFGGWVYTQHLPRHGWQSQSLASGGRAAAWGSPGYGGIMLLQRVHPSGLDSVWMSEYGSQGRWATEAGTAFGIGDQSTLAVQAAWSEDPGFHVLHAPDRGAIDTRSGVDLLSGSIRWAGDQTDGVDWEIGWHGWREDRINGTSLSTNQKDAHDLYVQGNQSLGSGELHLSLFRQWRNFRNLFSSAATDRNSEIPALEQFSVPAFSSGGALVWENETNSGHRYQLGTDFRENRATVRERFFYVNGALTRQREAGGVQRMAGAFWQPQWRPEDSNWEWHGLIRLDRYQFRDGFRRETEPATDTTLRDETATRRSGTELSAYLEARWQPVPEAQLNAGMHRGHRLPTLNELYRPYRVRNDIVEANPDLGPERVWGVDFGGWWQIAPQLRLSTQIWHQWLDHMVTNVLVVEGPSSDPLFGFVPANGSGSQRQAVSGNRAYGSEWTLSGSLNTQLDWYLSAAWNRTRFGASETDPSLEGRPFPLSAGRNLRLGGLWSLNEQLQLGLQSRWQGRADEDSGRGSLPAYGLVDVQLNWQMQPSVELQVQLENLFDTTVVTAVSSDGLESVGAPRNLNLSLRYRF